MQYKILGKNGPKVSLLSFGTWLTMGQMVDFKTSARCVSTALSLGINSFDTADSYGQGAAERFLGETLRGTPRDQLVIGTKCFFPMSETQKGLSRKHIFESVESSLRNLRTDYLDLMQCHRFDPETPLVESITALNDLIREGKVRFWGVSRWTGEQVDEAISISQAQLGANPVSNQWPYNIINNGIEPELMPMSEKSGVGITVYSPLAQGVLTGKYSVGKQAAAGTRASNPEPVKGMWDYTPKTLQLVASLAPIAREMGVTMSQMALAWCMRKPIVASVIIGASQPEQIVENTRALDVRLSSRQIERIEAIMGRKF